MTPRYKLRTLLILLAVLPPLLWLGWTKYEAWRAEQERQRVLREAAEIIFAWPAAKSGPGPIPSPTDDPFAGVPVADPSSIGPKDPLAR